MCGISNDERDACGGGMSTRLASMYSKAEQLVDGRPHALPGLPACGAVVESWVRFQKKFEDA